MKKLLAAVFALITAAALAAAAEGDAKAKDFSLPGLGGKEFRLADSLGKGYIVINFWAAWCSSCAEEVPELAALMKEPGAEKALFLGVNVGDKQVKAARFVKKHNYPYRPLLDLKRTTAKDYGVMGLPVTIIIDRGGKIVFRGARPPKKFDFTK